MEEVRKEATPGMLGYVAWVIRSDVCHILKYLADDVGAGCPREPGHHSRGASMKRFKWESAHPGNRCGHPYCSDCRTRRGRNRGNRNARHRVRGALRQLLHSGTEHD